MAPPAGSAGAPAPAGISAKDASALHEVLHSLGAPVQHAGGGAGEATPPSSKTSAGLGSDSALGLTSGLLQGLQLPSPTMLAQLALPPHAHHQPLAGAPLSFDHAHVLGANLQQQTTFVGLPGPPAVTPHAYGPHAYGLPPLGGEPPPGPAPPGPAPAAAKAKKKKGKPAAKGKAPVGQPKKQSSKHRGVTKHRRTGRWEAHVWADGKQVYLGGFDEEDRAGRAYDLVAIRCRGSRAETNFPLRDYGPVMSALVAMTRDDLVQLLRRRSKGFSRGKSKCRGVTKHKCGKWEARLGFKGNKKYRYLGLFNEEADAARAHDRAAVLTFGIDALTNYDLACYEAELQQHWAAQAEAQAAASGGGDPDHPLAAAPTGSAELSPAESIPTPRTAAQHQLIVLQDQRKVLAMVGQPAAADASDASDE